jgi:dipeptidyl aminopeptidase/acylaminoacyl peptidase
MFAFTVTGEKGIEVWIGRTATASARRLTGPNVNGIAGPYSWMPDSRRLLVHFVPDGRRPTPEASPVPTGPVVQESRDRVSPVRTYQDLLQDPHDEVLFEHYFTSQLAIVDTADGKRLDLGDPAIYRQASVSPDGRYLLQARVTRPYSYMVPFWLFPADVELRDLESGDVRRLSRLPLGDQVPIQGVITGPRSHRWRAVMGTSAVTWVEALDDGDPKKDVPHRDKVMMLQAPFDGRPAEIARLEDRYSGISWIEMSSLAAVSEYDRDERWTRTWLISPGSADAPKLVFDRSVQDRYGDPGRPVMVTNAAGKSVARLADGWAYLAGRGASPDGDRPFLDRLSLETLESQRLWRSEGACYESFVELLPGDRILTRYETPTEPPNYLVRDLATGQRTAVTHFEHPAPQLRDVSKELVTAAGPRAGRAPAPGGLGVPAGVQRPVHGQPGARLTLPLHVHPRLLPPVPAPAGLRDHGRGDDADRGS